MAVCQRQDLGCPQIGVLLVRRLHREWPRRHGDGRMRDSLIAFAALPSTECSFKGCLDSRNVHVADGRKLRIRYGVEAPMEDPKILHLDRIKPIDLFVESLDISRVAGRIRIEASFNLKVNLRLGFLASFLDSGKCQLSNFFERLLAESRLANHFGDNTDDGGQILPSSLDNIDARSTSTRISTVAFSSSSSSCNCCRDRCFVPLSKRLATTLLIRPLP